MPSQDATLDATDASPSARNGAWQGVAILIAAIYLYFPVSEPALFSPNELSRIFLTESIAERGRLDIDPAVERHGVTVDMAFFDDHFYSDKAIGLSLAAVPIYKLLWSLSGHTLGPRELIPICRKVTVTLPAFLLIAALLRRYPNPLAGVLMIGLALGSSFFPFALSFFGHVPMTILILLLFWRAACDPPKAASPGWHLANGLLAGAAILVDYTSAIFVALLALHQLSHRRSLVDWICYGAGLLACLSILLVYNTLTLGHPLDLAYNHMALAGEQPHRAQGFFGIGLPIGTAVWGLTFGVMRGLFVHSPFLLLIFPAALALGRPWRWRRRDQLAGATVLAYFWLNASLVDWAGGWSMGPRYLMPVYPFMIVLILHGWQRETPRGRRLYEGFAVATVVWACLLHLAAVGTWLHTPTDPLRFATLELASHLLVNNQVAENAGTILGLVGWISLLPIVALGLLAFAISGRPWRPSTITSGVAGAVIFLLTTISVHQAMGPAQIEKAETVRRVLVSLAGE